MRIVILAAALFAGCAPRPVEPPKPDPVNQAWYGAATDQLKAWNREAENLIRSGKPMEAAEIINKGQPLMSRLLSVPRPTLAAMEAVSDLDHLYARMLLGNRHYGWARLLFQKNVARWTVWRPQTEDTARRRKLAESGVAECDRGLAGGGASSK